MSYDTERPILPSTIRAADTLAARVAKLVMDGQMDSRCPVADALLDYAYGRFGSEEPLSKLVEHAEKNGLLST